MRILMALAEAYAVGAAGGIIGGAVAWAVSR